MSPSEPELTPELQGRILSFVRAGCAPPVAAEAAGVSRRLFEKWLRHGRQSPYGGFAAEVRTAAAQARLRAEVAIFDKRPLDWLKCGPGKETSRRPGWSAAPRANSGGRSAASNALAQPALQRLLAQLLDRLTPFPEARTALADWMQSSPQSGR